MEKSGNEEFILDLLRNVNHNPSKSFESEDVSPDLADFMTELQKISEKFWLVQNKVTGVRRIRMYPEKLKHFEMEHPFADEADFIHHEIEESNLVIERANKNNVVQENVSNHLEKYNCFLSDKLHSIQDAVNSRKVESSKGKHLSFLINRSQVVALMLMLIDGSILSPITDHQLAKFIEKYFLFDTEKPMKAIINEIRQFRNLDKDTKKQETYLKGIFSKAEIRVAEK